MWIVVCIDMPVGTRSMRIYREQIVSKLKIEGFEAINKCLYLRYCSTLQNARHYKMKLMSIDYQRAGFSIMLIADQQMSQSYHYNGRTRKKMKEFHPKVRPILDFL